MANPTPWIDSVKQTKKLTVFLVNEGSLSSNAVGAFRDAVTAFNGFSSQTCVGLNIISSSASAQDQENANVKAFGLPFQKISPTVNMGGSKQTIEVSGQSTGQHGDFRTAVDPDKNQIMGAACFSPVKISLLTDAHPVITKLAFVHEFIHISGLDDNSLHSPSGSDVFVAVQPSDVVSNPPNPLLSQRTISLLKTVWCPLAGRRASLELESHPHEKVSVA